MNYATFKEKYDRLTSVNQNYKVIIFEFMRRIGKENIIEFEADFQKYFLSQKQAKKITYQEICDQADEKGIYIPLDTLKAYARHDRHTLKSQYSKVIAEILGVSEEFLLYGKDRITILSECNVDLKLLFEQMSEQNQKALIYLLDALYMEQIAPELFNDLTE